VAAGSDSEITPWCTVTALPRIDEHAIEVDASPEQVWSTISTALPRMLGGSRATAVASLLGCRDRRLDVQEPIEIGATVPGFHVAHAREPSLLALEGAHRFSTYALTFHIDELGPDRARLRAETHAAFPRLRGTVYRVLVIGTRGHVIAVRRMLRTIKRSAEKPQQAA
jgi:hypothetical protein